MSYLAGNPEYRFSRDGPQMKVFYFNKIETGIEIFSNKNCQVTFGFEYSIYLFLKR